MEAEAVVTERPDSLEELAARVGLEPMMTLDELAALSKESRRTLERRVEQKRLRVVHLSARAVRVSRSSAAAYLESRGAASPGREEATIHDLTDHLSEGGNRDC